MKFRRVTLRGLANPFSEFWKFSIAQPLSRKPTDSAIDSSLHSEEIVFVSPRLLDGFCCIPSSHFRIYSVSCGGWCPLDHQRDWDWLNRPISSSVGQDGCGTSESTPGRRWRKPFCLGVGGPSGSGKTLLASILQSNLEKRINALTEAKRNVKVVRICLDSFYRPLTPSQLQLHSQGRINFDIPEALDDDLMVRTIDGLLSSSNDIKISGYDYSTCERSEEGSILHSPPFDLVIVEGILSLHFESLRDLFDFKVYIDTDLDLCLARRIIRDREERGRQIEHILSQWINTVKPSTQQFCIPTKKFADLVLKGDAHDEGALALITEHIFQRQFTASQGQGQGLFSLLKK